MSENRLEHNQNSTILDGLQGVLFSDSLGSMNLKDFKQLTKTMTEQSNLGAILPGLSLMQEETTFTSETKSALPTAVETPGEHRENERKRIEREKNGHANGPDENPTERTEPPTKIPYDRVAPPLPPVEPGSEAFYKRMLERGNTPEKMEAAAKLGDGATATLNLLGNEVPVKVQMTETETDGVYLVNVYAYDDSGKPYVAYRAVYNENTGKVSHQTDKDGNEVPYMTEEFYKQHEYEVTQKDAERGRFALQKKEGTE